MKPKIILTLAFFLSLFTLIECNNQSITKIQKIESDSTLVESENVQQDYKKPEKLKVQKLQDQKVIFDTFKPIGWSKDGKFAFVVEFASEACDCFEMKLIVLDTKENKQLWVSEYNDQSTRKDLTYYWQIKYDSIKTMLNKFGIVQTNETLKLVLNSFEFEGNQYALNVKTTTEKEPDYSFDVIEDAEIILTSSKREIKIGNCTISKPSRIMSVNTVGFIRSPFENKIIVLYNNERIGYEGPPHVITVEVLGFDLTKI